MCDPTDPKQLVLLLGILSVEFYLGKTDKVKAGSLLELLKNGGLSGARALLLKLTNKNNNQ